MAVDLELTRYKEKSTFHFDRVPDHWSMKINGGLIKYKVPIKTIQALQEINTFDVQAVSGRVVRWTPYHAIIVVIRARQLVSPWLMGKNALCCCLSCLEGDHSVLLDPGAAPWCAAQGPTTTGPTGVQSPTGHNPTKSDRDKKRDNIYLQKMRFIMLPQCLRNNSGQNAIWK